MSRQDRLSRILEIVIASESVEVDKIAIALKVSAGTIRRDLDTLAKKQLLTRTHGGAIATGGSLGLPLSYRVAKDDQVKQRIAQAAAEMVSRYQIIGINGGTTTTEVARAIAVRPEFSPKLEDGLEPALTVVTNAVNIAAELTVRSQIKIVVTGGVARPNSYELIGPYAEEVLQEVNLDLAFLGVEAIDSIIGASARHEDEARVNRQMAMRAQKIVVVTDSSKFSKRAFACIRPVSEIDVLITDSGIDATIADHFRQLGVEIIIV